MFRARHAIAAAGLIVLTASCIGSVSPERKHRIAVFLFPDAPKFQPQVQVIEVQESVEKLDAHALVDQSWHGPYLQKKCDLCHESENYSMGLAKRLRVPIEQICTRCHTSEQFKGEYRHGPAEAGHCYRCHDPHRSKLPHLLLATGYELCGRCHTAETVKDMELHRSENGDVCTDCHDPHAADRAKLLK